MAAEPGPPFLEIDSIYRRNPSTNRNVEQGALRTRNRPASTGRKSYNPFSLKDKKNLRTAGYPANLHSDESKRFSGAGSPRTQGSAGDRLEARVPSDVCEGRGKGEGLEAGPT